MWLGGFAGRRSKMIAGLRSRRVYGLSLGGGLEFCNVGFVRRVWMRLSGLLHIIGLNKMRHITRKTMI